MDERPIGVFDSGIGGLTVVRALRQVLPHESIVYIGDTARVPYGTRSQATITRFAVEVLAQLLKKRVKLVVVACNTISAVAMEAVEQASTVSVVGVIGPTVAKALAVTRARQIGVIGTSATINSRVYSSLIKRLSPGVEVTEKATPLLVPIAEEGLFDHQVTRIMVEEYLKEIKENGMIDTLILGCTHYPLLRKVIENYMGSKVRVIDSAQPTALEVKKVLEEKSIKAEGAKPTQVFFTSDEPSRSHQIAQRFLGEDLDLNRISI